MNTQKRPWWWWLDPVGYIRRLEGASESRMMQRRIEALEGELDETREAYCKADDEARGLRGQLMTSQSARLDLLSAFNARGTQLDKAECALAEARDEVRAAKASVADATRRLESQRDNMRSKLAAAMSEAQRVLDAGLKAASDMWQEHTEGGGDEDDYVVGCRNLMGSTNIAPFQLAVYRAMIAGGRVPTRAAVHEGVKACIKGQGTLKYGERPEAWLWTSRKGAAEAARAVMGSRYGTRHAIAARALKLDFGHGTFADSSLEATASALEKAYPHAMAVETGQTLA